MIYKLFKTPMSLGICYMAIVLVGFMLKDKIGTSGVGPAIQYWPTWVWALIFLPGLLIIISHKYPNTLLGKIGLSIFNLFVWISQSKDNSQKKK